MTNELNMREQSLSMNAQPQLFGHTAPLQHGEQIKRDALKQLRDRNKEWMERAMFLAQAFCRQRPGCEFRMDQFRAYTLGQLPTPTSNNVFGSLPGAMIRAGLCVDTGRYEKSADPSAHSRAVKVYRVMA